MRAARALAAAVALLGLALAAWVATPLPPDLLDRREVSSLRLLDRHGGLLREVRSREDGRSLPLPGDAVPPRLRDAFLAAEDQRFLQHPGVDPLAVARAAAQGLRAGRVVSGASTVTMQLARRLRPHDRGWAGKAGEALWALRIDAHLPKDRILLEYLNRVPLGGDRVGVEAAARDLFGRPARELSVGQAALLAAMARAPSRLDPHRHPEAARAAMGRVLDRMVALDLLDPGDAARARATPLDLTAPRRPLAAPHLTSALLGSLDDRGLGDAVEVTTTLDPALQAHVERVVREEVAALAGRGAEQAAVVVLDNATGEVLAWVGSVDVHDVARGGWNDGVRARRQPGSAPKPLAYGLALASGYTPASVLADTPLRLPTPTGTWAPRNYDERLRGPVRLRAALASSYNVPAVRLVDDLGVDRVLGVLRAAGFDGLTEGASHYGAGLVLGNGEVTLLELARAYAGLARGGVVAPVVDVAAARDGRGRPLPPPAGDAPRRFLPADAVALLTDVLADEVARAPAFGLDHALRLPFPVAAKTGTSREFVDNWAVGFTRERTVAVWVGSFDGGAMWGVSGITGAGPIFRRVMLRAMAGRTPAPLVDRSRFERAAVCPLSGRRAGRHCPGALDEVFLPGTAPAHPCEAHGPDGAHADRALAAAGRRGGGGAAILHPADGDVFVLDPSLPLAEQRVPVRVRPPAGVARVELRTDDGRTIPLEAPFATTVPAGPGARWVELWVPGAGRVARVGFGVR